MKLLGSSNKLKSLLEQVTYRQWLIVAVLISCLMGALVYFSLSGTDSTSKDTPQVAMVKAVVAKQDIPARTVIKENMLKVVEVPADLVPAGAYSEVSEAIDRPASAIIMQGDIVTDRKVYKDVRMAGFTGMIPPNCRAVSIAITDITGVSGFAKAGDYVDIMLISGKKESGIKGEVLMQNVLLLGVNKTGEQAAKVANSSNNDNDKNKSKDKDSKDNNNDNSIKGSSDAMATATLALPLDEAMKLAAAAQKGTIYLVLRPYNPTDLFTLDRDYFIPADVSTQAATTNNSAKTSTPTVSQAVPAPRVSSPSVTTTAPPKSLPSTENYSHSIEVIRGVESTKVGVK